LYLTWIYQLISSISDDDSTIVISTLWSSYRDDVWFRLVVDRFVGLDGFNTRWKSSILSRRPGLRRQIRRTSSALMVVRLPCLNKWMIELQKKPKQSYFENASRSWQNVPICWNVISPIAATTFLSTVTFDWVCNCSQILPHAAWSAAFNL
jgi:hypothetical protein